MLVCYKCGASPNNPNKHLDTLRLIKCNGCGVVACTKHRDGIVGGKCAECGSQKSVIVAMKSNLALGGLATGGKKMSGPSISSGGGGGGGSYSGGNTAISKDSLKAMQEVRKQAAKAAKAAKDIAQKYLKQGTSESGGIASKARPAGLISSATGELDTKHDSKELQKLLGERKVVMDSCAIETVDTDSIAQNVKMITNGVSVEGGTSEGAGEGTGLDIGSNLSDVAAKISLSSVSAAAMIEVVSEDVETGESGLKKKGKDGPLKITLKDSFFVSDNPNLDEIIEQRKELEKDISALLAEEYGVALKKINLKLTTDIFIPLEDIDRFLINKKTYFKKNNINIITGINFSDLSYDLIEFLKQFEFVIKNKSFIKGVYGAFAENRSFDYNEQKDVMISLLEIALDNNKTFYMKMCDKDIKHWEKLFEEYELSDLKFIQTDVVTENIVADFMNQNKIKPLVNNDIDFEFYKEHFFKKSNKLILGSCGESSEFLSLLTNIGSLDEKFIERLRKS
ncbi:MAG: hypothetical protein GY793_06910 [Proteobacteria bacterium]|nr:hypothetical protein [Pseudomonadota bacterium]